MILTNLLQIVNFALKLLMLDSEMALAASKIDELWNDLHFPDEQKSDKNIDPQYESTIRRRAPVGWKA